MLIARKVDKDIADDNSILIWYQSLKGSLLMSNLVLKMCIHCRIKINCANEVDWDFMFNIMNWMLSFCAS